MPEQLAGDRVTAHAHQELELGLRHPITHRDPFVPRRLLRISDYRSSLWANFLLGTALMTGMVMVPVIVALIEDVTDRVFADAKPTPENAYKLKLAERTLGAALNQARA